MVDESTATKDPNIKKFNFHPMIPYKIKNNNLALPILSNKIKTNNIKKYEKLFISNILNRKKITSKNSEFFKFYHPWLSNISKVKFEEKKSSLPYYYNITKITQSTINMRKVKLNDAKNSFNTFKKNENVEQTIINTNNKRNNNISTNTNIGENNEEKRNLNNENSLKIKLKELNNNPLLEKIVNNNHSNSYFTLRRKERKRNSTIENTDLISKMETSKIKNNRPSFLNNKISFRYNKSNDDILKSYLKNKNTIIKEEYKIKSLKSNVKYY